MLAVAIPVGLLIGLSLGALGGGGSILTVPALVYLLGQTPHAATTGSLIVVGVTALAGTAAHWRAGRVRVGQGLAFGLLGVVGSYVGTRLSAKVDPHVLLTGFAALMLIAAGAMLRRSRAGDRAAVHELPDPVTATTARAPLPGSVRQPIVVLDRAPATTCALPGATAAFDPCRGVRVVAAATLVGLLTGFFGVGGGFVIVPALVLALGFEMPVAVGTSLLVISVNSLVALTARLGTSPHLNVPLLAAFAITAIAGSFAGNRVASKVEAARLTAAFTGLLVVVALYTATRSLPHLL